ncbi:MAG: GAF domain-containing protein [Moorea sp. SIO2B7]|nr:GAF domain-containing protein [Moorena sp. SIO2B7]
MMNLPNSPTLNFDSQEFTIASRERIALIEKLLAIGTALSSSHDLEELLYLILAKSREITYSDGGSVYLVDKTDPIPKLLFKVAQNDSLPNVSFKEFAVPLSPKSLAGYVALTGQTLNISDAYDLPAHLPYKLERSFDRDFAYRTHSLLVLPMQDQEGEIIGVLQLINHKIKPGVVVTPENVEQVTKPYSDWEERILRSLASQAAISIERNTLQESIENLFEGFVKASVQAIESRDPTTSGHSERVAQLTVRLTEQVNSINTGPLRLYHFSDRQIQEIRYAALLHDFGKIGVPEAILTKRQKIHPKNLEIIRQRFAVAQRTLEMECAENKFKYLVEHPAHHHSEDDSSCPHCQQLAQLDKQLQKAIEELNEYWILIEEFNQPEAIATKRFQALSEKVFVELTTLAQYTYKDIDGQMKPLVTPEEMEQLMIPRGNLNIAERLAIESHVTHSYEFLKEIPWTKNLKEVPIIAYGHHEKLDGSGYPQGLKKQQIPIQTQIMAVTDIYDALTARDRPYKKSLPVNVVLGILYEEAAKNKINYDLVKLFEQRQVFKILGHSLESHS